MRRTFIDFDSPSDEPKGIARCRSWPSTASEALAAAMTSSVVDDSDNEEDIRPTMVDRKSPGWHRQDLSPSLSASLSVSTASTCSPLDVAAVKDADSISSVASSAQYAAHQSPVRYIFTPTSARAALSWRSLTQAAMPVKEASPRCEVSSGGEEEDEDVHICPIYSEHAELPSLGSAGHGEGTCRRCCFFPKGRCFNSMDCEFCHFAHEKRNKKKSSKKKKNKKSSKAHTMSQYPNMASGGQPVTDSKLKDRPVPLMLQTAIPAEETNLDGFEGMSYECFALMPVPVQMGYEYCLAADY